MPKSKLRVAVFTSGNGSNLEALLQAEKRLGAEIALVVCDRVRAYSLIRALNHKKQAFLIPSRYYSNRKIFEERIINVLKEKRIDLVVLAGFMRILTPSFVRAYAGRVINVHPSLLPAFKGAHAIRDAYDDGCPMTGVTIHFVTEDLDAGPVILQAPVKRTSSDTFASLEAKIHKVEHKLYPQAVRLFAAGKIKRTGRRVKILK